MLRLVSVLRTNSVGRVLTGLALRHLRKCDSRCCCSRSTHCQAIALRCFSRLVRGSAVVSMCRRAETDVVSGFGCNALFCAKGLVRFVASSSSDTEDKNMENSSEDDDDDNGDEGRTSSSDSSESDSEENLTRQNNKPFSDADIDKELLRYDYEDFEVEPETRVEALQPLKKPIPISLYRGVAGVFDVEELVELLRDENARDICVIKVPKEYNYVDYMVIVTGRSTRHLRAMAEYVKWTFKRKRSPGDWATVKIEGQLTNDWFAVDLGNIALHLFLRDTRLQYDLETLWTVGVEHDDKLRREVLDEFKASMQLEEFSFDAELEQLRRLRGLDKSRVEETDSEDISAGQTSEKGMETVADWHKLPDR